ncbi:MAG: HEAT repeat domain-containing protein [Treponema sp.]|nr:HEAT repeat domain-containing protein [Treponema sp.]
MGFILFSAALLFAQPDLEEVQLNTIKFGTETEIAALIQTLRTEEADYLDEEIIALVEHTRNQKILAGALAFFGEREKNDLADRAIRAIEERDDEANETVLAAIDYLGKIKAGNADSFLRELLERGEPRFMNAAFRALGRVGGSGEIADDIAEYLVDYYENRDPGDGNRREVIIALGNTGSVKAVEFLAGIATDSEERIPLRISALESLAKIGDPSGLDAVLTCVSAKDPNIRSAAVTALGPFSGEAVDAAILDAFRDSFFRTRVAAAQASRQRKLAAAVPYLKFRAERDEVPAVRDDAIRALGAIANSDAIKILEDLFTERKNSERVRIIAGEMIMQIDPGKFLDSFVKELDEAKQKRQTALYNGLIKIIGTVKSPNIEPIARRLMQDRGVVEKSTGLDIAANNNLVGLADEIRVIAEDKNEGLARRARRTLEKLGIQ